MTATLSPPTPNAALLRELPVAVCQFDAEGRLAFRNRCFDVLYGLTGPDAADGCDADDLLTAVEDSGLRSALGRVLGGEDSAAAQNPDGRRVQLRRVATPEGFAVVHEIEQHDRRRPDGGESGRDPLTGLHDRGAFLAELDRGVAGAAETFEEVALLYLDLDRFKPVNDTLGHEAGDRLLAEVAARVSREIRPGDVFGRLGGDEFAILQAGAPQPGGSRALGRRIIESLSRPFHLEGHTVTIGVSIGTAVAPFDADTAPQLVRASDLAMYAAKHAGRNVMRYFEPQMHERMQARRSVEAELREAVGRDQLRLYYQPAKDVVSGDVSCIEALVRWEHPTLGFVRPDEFIPLAEETGLIVQVGEWVLQRACVDAAGWRTDAHVAVNVSPVQLRSRTFVQTVMDALKDSGLPAGRLELEVTENALMADTDLTIAILTELRERGVKIAMDDFGTGYSSINYLRRFPIDKIKIDRSFVSGATPDSESAALIRMIAALGSSLAVQTTAEGVETDDELDIVRDAGCSQMQGYLLSRPVDGDTLAAFLKGRA